MASAGSPCSKIVAPSRGSEKTLLCSSRTSCSFGISLNTKTEDNNISLPIRRHPGDLGAVPRQREVHRGRAVNTGLGSRKNCEALQSERQRTEVIFGLLGVRIADCEAKGGDHVAPCSFWGTRDHPV